MNKLECSIIQFSGNKEKAINWLNRMDSSINTNIVDKLQWGEFIFFDGAKIEIFPNTTRSYTLTDA